MRLFRPPDSIPACMHLNKNQYTVKAAQKNAFRIHQKEEKRQLCRRNFTLLTSKHIQWDLGKLYCTCAQVNESDSNLGDTRPHTHCHFWTLATNPRRQTRLGSESLCGMCSKDAVYSIVQDPESPTTDTFTGTSSCVKRQSGNKASQENMGKRPVEKQMTNTKVCWFYDIVCICVPMIYRYLIT